VIIFAREPIFDPKQQLFAYQLVFRDGEEGRLPQKIVDNTSSENTGLTLDDLFSGSTVVVSVKPQGLLNGLQERLSSQSTIIEIDNSDSINDSGNSAGDDERIYEAIVALKQVGFRFVIEHSKHAQQNILALADFIKVDTQCYSIEDINTLALATSHTHAKLVATNVHTLEEYKRCINAKFDYFQGFFFLHRQNLDNASKKRKQNPLAVNKLTVMRLLAQTSNTDINLDDIRTSFEHDATLSYLLMRFINNPMVNKSHEIKSIKHALNYLGEMMLRQFVAIVSIAQLNQDNMQELLEVSLVRAKYCELLNNELAEKQDAMSAFMTGLFSLIDVILDRDMTALLKQVPISTEISEALLQQAGSYYPLIASVKALESSSWLTFKRYARELAITEEAMHACYLQAVKWNNDLLKGQSDMFPRAKP
jgi:EAL and modified HD-GYP domain-containing signal transduction protein